MTQRLMRKKSDMCSMTHLEYKWNGIIQRLIQSKGGMADSEWQ